MVSRRMDYNFNLGLVLMELSKGELGSRVVGVVAPPLSREIH